MDFPLWRLGGEAVTWWRVEFGHEGEITCTPVYAARGREDQRVWYVEADSEEAARAAAIRMRARARLAERRAKYKAQGLCRCGRERDSEQHRECALCRERHATDEKRRSERIGVSRNAAKLHRGPVAGDQRVNPGPMQAQRRAGLKQTERLAVLLEVRSEFERTRKLGMERDKHFLLWLIGQINKAKGTP